MRTEYEMAAQQLEADRTPCVADRITIPADTCQCESKWDAGYRRDGWIVCARCHKRIG